ncbi:hypothetical protein EV426DRAFT_612494 [Tirmania nivea]|nr:hypothetical protein EV426DRAFT_612494 [Tirmania nivea]
MQNEGRMSDSQDSCQAESWALLPPPPRLGGTFPLASPPPVYQEHDPISQHFDDAREWKQRRPGSAHLQPPRQRLYPSTTPLRKPPKPIRNFLIPLTSGVLGFRGLKIVLTPPMPSNNHHPEITITSLEQHTCRGLSPPPRASIAVSSSSAFIPTILTFNRASTDAECVTATKAGFLTMLGCLDRDKTVCRFEFYGVKMRLKEEMGYGGQAEVDVGVAKEHACGEVTVLGTESCGARMWRGGKRVLPRVVVGGVGGVQVEFLEGRSQEPKIWRVVAER